MSHSLDLLTQIATGVAKQFGRDCEVVIHDLRKQDVESSVAFIENGHITKRKIGDAPSPIVLEALHRDPKKLKDQLGYLTRTSDGRILKSSTMYIRNDSGVIDYIFAINYDITALITVENSLKSLVGTDDNNPFKKPQKITHNVNDLLDSLIEQSVAMIGKPVALMNKEERVTAIQFLNDAGAFLITKSSDKVAKYFDISKYTLYSYIDINK